VHYSPPYVPPPPVIALPYAPPVWGEKWGMMMSTKILEKFFRSFFILCYVRKKLRDFFGWWCVKKFFGG
jgi:hypothetical protein